MAAVTPEFAAKMVGGGMILRATGAALLLLCLALAACSSAGDTGLLLLADPGKYQYHNCQQLIAARTALVNRQKELRGLIDKAEQETGGVIVGVIAYRSDYAAVNQDLKTLDATWRDKNCAPPPAPRAPPTDWQSGVTGQ
jgi:hypothetical protein